MKVLNGFVFFPLLFFEVTLGSRSGSGDLLVDHLDDLLVYDSLSEETKAAITATLEDEPVDGPGDTGALADRVSLAVLLIMTSPDYLVQR